MDATKVIARQTNVSWKQWREAATLLAILVLALVLRVAAADFGLPYTYHPDEGALIMPALRILQTGDFNPHRFDYGSAYIYALSGLYVLYFLMGVGAGAFRSIQSIPVIDDYSSIVRYPVPTVFLAGRLFNAIIGTLTVLLVYILVRRILGRKHALVAALLLAVARLHVILSHFTTADVPMVLATVVSLLAMLYAADTHARIDRLVVAFLCGLTISIKYPAMPIVSSLVVLFVQTTAKRERIWLEVMLGLFVLVAGFLVGTPYSVLDLPTFLDWLARQLSLHGTTESARLTTSLGWYLRYAFSIDNIWLTVPALLGIPFLRGRVSKSVLWLVFVFPVLFAIQVSLGSTHYARLILPLWPFLALLASCAVIDGSSWVMQRFRVNAVWLPNILLMALVLIMGFISARYDYLLAQEDVRTRALRWIEANLPRNSHLVADRFPPPLSRDEWKVAQLVRVTDRSLDWYREQQVQFVVVSQAMRKDVNQTEKQSSQYQALTAEWSLLTVIEGPFIGNADFDMWIYQVP